jgi:hypothetical protein
LCLDFVIIKKNYENSNTYFTMQKYNVQKNPLKKFIKTKKTKILWDIIFIITKSQVSTQAKKKYHLSEILIWKN